MFWWSREETLAWILAQGLERVGADTWRSIATGEVTTGNDIAHDLYGWPLDETRSSLTNDEWVNLGFGLLDLLDDYGVAMYLAWEFVGVNPTHGDHLDLVWKFCREVLERPEGSEAVLYWLWVDWYEDPNLSATAFLALTSDDDGVKADDPARMRRVGRVIANSGPAPWPEKSKEYTRALAVPELHVDVFYGLRGSAYDIYGQIDVANARQLLDQLRLPAELAPEVAELRAQFAKREQQSGSIAAD